jgi:ubiquinone/menaquinone biosynthesis C-methylase UbiE
MSPDHVTRNEQQQASESDPFTESRYAQFARLLPPGALRVLDVGCNTGRGGAALKRLRPEVQIHGLDLLQSRLDRLPKDVYAGTVCGSATQIPSGDESYDAVVAGEFIEHLLPIDAHRFVADAFRVLKLNGRLLLTTPNPGDIKLRLRGGTVLGGAHLSQHHPGTLKTVLKMFGFSRVRVMGSGKVSWYLGSHFPLLALYGSYLVVGHKR